MLMELALVDLLKLLVSGAPPELPPLLATPVTLPARGLKQKSKSSFFVQS